MSFWDQLKWSFRHSKKQLLESLLVVVAIALGVGVIVTVLTLFLSVGRQYRDIEHAEHFRTLELLSKAEFSGRQGAPLTLIGADLQNGDWSATLEEVAELQSNLPSTMYAFVQMHWLAKTPLLPEEAESDEEPIARRWYYDANQIYIVGTTPEYFAFNGATLQMGNFFLSADIKSNSRVMVLTDSLATELFGDDDPLGQVIPLIVFGDEESIDYTVIGVLDPPEDEEAAYFGYGNTRMAYAPVTASPYSRFEGDGQGLFRNVSIGIDAGVDLVAAAERAESEARLIWEDQIAVRNSLAEFRESQKQMQRYALLIGVFASVGLVIAVINILNLMLARVLKRTKSIGLSMALGSSRHAVFRQFMLEALSLGILGSIFGILLSFALVLILQKALGGFLMESMSGTRIALGIAMGFAVSLFFGVYPAHLGSRTNPVDALRTD